MGCHRWFTVRAVALAALGAACAAAVPAFADDPDTPFTIADNPALTPARAEATSLPYRLGLVNLARDGQQPVRQDDFETSATVGRKGAAVTIAVQVKTTYTSPVIVDVEINDPIGRRVDQQYIDDMRLPVGRPATMSFAWTPPANAPAGQYTVRVGIFEGGWQWQNLHHWNDAAAVFTLP